MERWKELKITDFKRIRMTDIILNNVLGEHSPDLFSYIEGDYEICIEPLFFGRFYVAIYKDGELLEPKLPFLNYLFFKKEVEKHVNYLYKKYIRGGENVAR